MRTTIVSLSAVLALVLVVVLGWAGLREMHADLVRLRDEVQALRVAQEAQTAVARAADPNLAAPQARPVAGPTPIEPPPTPSDLTRLNDELRSLRAAQTAQGDEHRLALRNLTALLGRAVGNQIPVELPAGTLERLDALEWRVREPNRWPATADQADQFQKAVAEFVRTAIPPWAEPDVLPRLTVLRWGAAVFDAIRRPDTVGPDDVWLERLHALTDARPDNAPEELSRELDRRLAEGLKAAADRRAGATKAKARDLLKEAAPDPLAVADTLTALDGLVPPDDESRGLAGRLRTWAAEQQAVQKVGVLLDGFRAGRALPTDTLRAAAVARVRDAATGVLIDLHSQPSPRPARIQEVAAIVADCDELTRKAAAQQQNDLAVRWRAYQKWAVDQIQEFDGPDGWYYDDTHRRVRDALNSFGTRSGDFGWGTLAAFPAVAELIKARLGVDLGGVRNGTLTEDQQRAIYTAAYGTLGWKDNIDQEIAYTVTREAMAKHLLPINQSLLDQPVAQLYQQAFQKGWAKLEGREDRLELAKRSATVTKRGLE